MPPDQGPIRLHPENPRYFWFRGRTRVLITATEHYGAVLNRNFDYVAYLDEAVRAGATLSRCFLLFRELESIPLNPHSPCKPRAGEYVAPFERSGPGFAVDGFPKFDLDRWDDEYFERLHGFLSEAERRGIVVELTLFSNTYADSIWKLNPLNVANNVNGVGAIDWQDYNSMRDGGVWRYQQAHVRKIVDEVNRYDNIYFEICNEPFGDHPGHVSVADVDAWQDSIRTLIRDREAGLPKQHLIFQVAVERTRGDSPLDRLVDEPAIDAINLHDYQQLTFRGVELAPLGRFMQRDLKLARIQYLWTQCHDARKPLVFDEDNAATNALDDEAWTIHRKRAWTTVCSGGHYDMIDFSIQAAGQERGTPAAREAIRDWLKQLSAFVHGLDIAAMVPVRGFCSAAPSATLAVTLARAGAEYVVYLADQRERDEHGQGEPCAGMLAFELPSGAYHAHLFEPSSGRTVAAAVELSGGPVELQLEPFVHDLVVHITADKEPQR